jgi:hypothetical protein
MEDLLLEPEIADAALGHIFDFYHDYHRRIFEAGRGRIDLTYVAEDLGSQTGPLVSLATYAITAAVVFAVQRPELRRLQARDGIATDADREAWRAKARRQRYVAYAVTTAVGMIAFLMSAKPALW